MTHSWSLVGRALIRCVLAGGLTVAAVSAWADDEEARALYAEICSKCHGLIAEDVLSWTPENLLVQAVTMPLGPPLSTVYGREAGTMKGYAYSRAFREAIENPWTWDEDSLDLWITNTQQFIRGTTMFLKVEDEDQRRTIIDYLKKYAQYRPE